MADMEEDLEETVHIGKTTLSMQNAVLSARHNSFESTDVQDYRSALFDDHKLMQTEARQ